MSKTLNEKQSFGSDQPYFAGTIFLSAVVIMTISITIHGKPSFTERKESVRAKTYDQGRGNLCGKLR